MIKTRGEWAVPGEIESAILSIDGVKEAVVSSWQDAGNEVRIIAHLVPGDRSAPSVTLLRQRLGEILPSHMVPTNYVWLERLPLNANGKIDRGTLPFPSGKRPELQHPFLGHQSLLQLRIAQVWEELLDVQPVGIRDNFFDLGGHSLLAARMIDRIEGLFGRRLPLSILYQAPDIESLADAMVSDEKDLQAPIVTIQSGGNQTPFFFLHGDYLSGGFFTMELARCLGRERPFHALPPYGLDGGPVPPSYEGMADLHLENLRAFRPHGPYLLGGVCNGGLVAFEMARRLLSQGEKVEQLVLIGASAVGVRFRSLGVVVHAFGHLAGLGVAAKRRLSHRMRDLILNMGSVPLHRRPGHILKKATKIPGEVAELFRLSRRTGRGDTASPEIESGPESAENRRNRIRDIYQQIDKDYIPGAYPGRITLLWAEEDDESPQDALRYWKKVSPNVEMHIIPGDYGDILTINLSTLGERLRVCLS
jgi:acyl carrier protein